MTRLFTLAIMAIILSTACAVAAPVKIKPSSGYVTRIIKAPSFKGLTTNTAIDITYTVGSQKVELYAPANMIDYIKVSVEDGNLTVKYTENMQIEGRHETVLRVTAPAVSRFRTNSAGDIKILSNLNLSGDCQLTTNSAGDITGRNIKAAKVKCLANSAGDIELASIEADEVSLLSNSAGDIKVASVKARGDATLNCNSAGDIDVKRIVAGNCINANSNSAGDIEVDQTKAETINTACNSAGDVKLSYIAAGSVNASSRSVGTIRLDGICSTASFANSSVGDISADRLKALDVTIDLRGRGEVRCQAVNNLDVTRHGSGVVYTRGNPVHTELRNTRGNTSFNNVIRKL